MGNAKSKRDKELREKDIEERRKRQESARIKKEEEEEKIRQQERDKKRGPLVPVLQSAARGYLARQEYAKLLKIVARRKKIAEEILSTEVSYVNSLKLLQEDFYTPLMQSAINEDEKKIRGSKKRRKTLTGKDSKDTKETLEEYYLSSGSNTPEPTVSRKSTLMNMSQPMVPFIAPDIPGLSKEDVKAIFPQLEVILAYNEKLAARIEERVKNWTWTTELGDIFQEMLDFLKVYVQYVNNYNTALAKIDSLRQIPEFASWLEKTENKRECNGNTISMFLIMPIQRIPRYVLLLEDLVKHSPEPHIDHANLAAAVKRMKDVAIEINEKKRDAENFSIIVDIYKRLDGEIDDLCAAHRKFVKEGQLKFDGAYYTFFLFNDILLKTKEKDKRKLKLLMHITLRTASIEDIPDDKAKNIKNSFLIITTRKEIIVRAKTPEEKLEWMSLIQENIKIQVEKTKSFANLRRESSVS